MLEAHFKECLFLKRIIEPIRDIITEANFDFSENGLSMKAMDTTHISLISLTLTPQAFEKYRCDEEITLGIPIASLHKVLKCAENSDSVQLAVDEEDLTVANLHFESTQMGRTADFRLYLTNTSSSVANVNVSDYPTMIEMPAAEFRRIVTDLNVLGTNVTIEVSNEGANFKFKGETGDGAIFLHSASGSGKRKSRDFENEVIVKCKAPLSMTLPVSYLNHYIKAAPLASSVILFMKQDTPVCIEFPMLDEVGVLTFYIAPQVEGYQIEKKEKSKKKLKKEKSPVKEEVELQI